MYMQLLIFLDCSTHVIVTIWLAMCLHLPGFTAPASMGEKNWTHIQWI